MQIDIKENTKLLAGIKSVFFKFFYSKYLWWTRRHKTLWLSTNAELLPCAVSITFVYRVTSQRDQRETTHFTTVNSLEFSSSAEVQTGPTWPIKALTSLPLGRLPKTLDSTSANWLYVLYNSSTHPKVTHVECISFHCNQNIVPETHSAR
jgi:hypothetical protein